MKEDKQTKANWDMRQSFGYVITNYLNDIRIAQVNCDYVSWYRLLRGFGALVNPYIHKDKSEEFFISIEEVKKHLNNSRFFKSNLITDEQKALKTRSLADLFECLTDSTMIIFEAAKDLLLPVSSDENPNWDDDSYLEGSSQ